MPIRSHTLEPGHDHDSALIECIRDAIAAYLLDLGLGVPRIRYDPDLRSRERDGLVTKRVDRHRKKSDRDLLARGKQHVHLTLVRDLGNLLR